MKNKYPRKVLQLVAVLAIAASSCKKNSTPAPIANAKPVSIGLFEYASSGDSRIFIPLSKIGTQTVNYDEIFDTGSTGLTIDASGIVPSTKYSTSTGFNIAAGDSLVVNGITITSDTLSFTYGNKINWTKESGNLAYASITIPDEAGNGVTIKRIAMFLYYQFVDQDGNKLAAHSGDIFGVGPGPNLSINNSSIASPLSYYSPGTGLTKGFKLATLVSGGFVGGNGTYEEGLLTLGLTSDDLNSSGFIMHPLSTTNPGGYSPDIPGTITYGSKTISAELLFDTGTPQFTIIEDRTVSSLPGPLPANTLITVKTNQGFTYSYTTSSTNDLTQVLSPFTTGDPRSIFSIDFFENNEFLTDYAGHRIGLKNN